MASDAPIAARRRAVFAGRCLLALLLLLGWELGARTLGSVFFAAPLGLWPSDPAAYATFLARWGDPLVRLFFFVLIGGSLFHGTHRLKFILMDAGFKGPGPEALLDLILNGVAILGSLVAVYYVLHGWLFF